MSRKWTDVATSSPAPGGHERHGSRSAAQHPVLHQRKEKASETTEAKMPTNSSRTLIHTRLKIAASPPTLHWLGILRSLSPPSCCQPTSLITPGSSPRIDQRATPPYCTLTASEPCLNRQRHSLIPYLPLVALDIHSTNRRAWHKGTCSTPHLHKALRKRRLFLEIEDTLIRVCPGIDPGTPRRQELQSVP